MKRSEDRILTTHVGSLIRPPELQEFLAAKRDGKTVDESAFDACLERSVRDAVRRQAEVGLDVINDGELGKTISWSRYVLERMTGFEHRMRDPADPTFPQATVGRDRREFADFYRTYDPAQGFTGMTGWHVTGPISYKGQAEIQADIDRLKRALNGVPCTEAFMPAVAPASVAPDRSDHYYKNDADYLAAVADALHVEYQAIVDAGFILQIDDARRWARQRVEVLNHALRNIPPERVRHHTCYGINMGPRTSDMELKHLADLIVTINAGYYSFEMSNPRHEHEWKVWESVKLPDGKVLLPGCISHASVIVEHPELVAERILRLARIVGRERVMAGSDCGFASTLNPNERPEIEPEIVWAKFASLVEGARLATKTLWG